MLDHCNESDIHFLPYNQLYTAKLFIPMESAEVLSEDEGTEAKPKS
jgi:hypothetical protein